MLKVVILDGNSISRDLLNTVLTNGGHHVVGDSNTSPAGLAKIIKLRPQVVCIDIGEANSDGLALLDSIRSELPKTLVFLVSGKLDPATVEGALQRGVQGFIVKPFNPQTVHTTIRNAILKFARRQHIRQDGSAPAQTQD